MSVVQFGIPVDYRAGNACRGLDNADAANASFLKNIRASRTIEATEVFDVKARLADFRLVTSFKGIQRLEYAVERRVGGGSYGSVFLFRLVGKNETRAPERIAVKIGLLENGEHEIAVLNKMNRIDEALGSANRCDRLPAFVVPNVGNDVFVVVLRPADGDLSSLFTRRERMHEKTLVQLVDGILKEMECIRWTYGMVMTDFKTPNLVYSCKEGGKLDVAFTDYGSFHDEQLQQTESADDLATFPPIQSFVAESNGTFPTQPSTLYMLFPLILQLSSGGVESMKALAHVSHTKERDTEFKKRQAYFRNTFALNPLKLSEKMLIFLRFITGYMPTTDTIRMDASHNLEAWFAWNGSTYASTYQDARQLLTDLFREEPPRQTQQIGQRLRNFTSALLKRS